MSTEAEKAIQNAIIEVFEEMGNTLTKREEEIVDYSVSATLEIVRWASDEED